MPVFEDWLKEPLRIIHNIYASDSANFDIKVNEYFENKLKSEKNYYSIPCLNDISIHELAPHCLVRYRCMIQDSSNPEYYVSHHKLMNKTDNDILDLPSKYKDVVKYPEGYELYNEMLNDEQQVLHHNAESLSQRLTFYCVPIPGENEWVKTTHKLNSFSSSVCGIASTSNTQYRPSKRGIDEQDDSYNEECSVSESKIEFMNCTNQVNEQSSGVKRTKVVSNNDTKITNPSNSINLNNPLRNSETGVTCLVKVYDNFEAYKINDLVEFIGILSFDPTLAFCNQCLNEQQQQQQQASNDSNNKMETDHEMTNYLLESCRQSINTCSCAFAPPSLVPRLHAIKSFHLKHDNPLLGNIYNECKLGDQEGTFWKSQMLNLINNLAVKSNHQLSTAPAAVIDSSNLHLLIKLRQDIINYFQEYLLIGDSLAAEYLLMNLVSAVFTRKDVTVLGKFTLNIFNIPANKTGATETNTSFSDIFYKYFKDILTTSHLFKLSVDSLNQANLIPNKDYDNDKLLSGMLQLPDRFQLVIDETTLNAGELKQKGLLNLQGLNDIIKWQKLNYDFGFHSHEFLTNIRILILSNTKSILSHDCQFKLNPSVPSAQFKHEEYEANLQLFHSNEQNLNLLNNLRKYLTIISKLDYTLTEPMQKIVEEDFVHLRQGSQHEKICVEDFHLLLVIARLQCLTYGKSELSLNEWNKAKYLEKERKARLI